MGVIEVTDMSRRAVFLDRDGVLNRSLVSQGKPYPPASPDEVEILPGVLEALRRLRAAGFLLICVTNQPDVARGTQRRDVVEAIHRVLLQSLDLDEILTCYHDDDDCCACRKPRPGLLLEAATRHAINLGESFMVGDRWRDIEAGHRAGCCTILIEYGYLEEAPPRAPDFTTGSLSEAAAWILNRVRRDA
jgi:D-glycero-D-manno-heptose 1,7-bisphosphate phosphatase